MNWFIRSISCLWLAACNAPSDDDASRSEGERARVPSSVTSNAALPLVEADEAKARAQVARDLEAQPEDVQRRYYTALVDALDRSIALGDEQIANFEQDQRGGLSKEDTRQALTRAQTQRARWAEQRQAAAAGLARLEARK